MLCEILSGQRWQPAGVSPLKGGNHEATIQEIKVFAA
jgi:hypothetical protein